MIGKDYKIFVDTCAFMNNKAELFFDNFLPKLDNNRLLIPDSVISELEYKKKSTYPKTRKAAMKGYDLFERLWKDGIAKDFATSKYDTHTDNVFVSIFTKYRLQYKLCLITLDNGLSTEVIKLNISESSGIDKSGRNHIKGIKVLRYDYKGTHYLYTIPYAFEKPVRHIEVKNSKILNTNLSLKVGDYVYDDDHYSYKINNEIGKGREGHIYSLNDKVVAKIFNKEELTDLKVQKLRLMLKNKMYIKSVCWPISLLYNQDKEPIGYLMKKVRDNAQELHSIIGYDKVHSNFPDFTTIDLVKVSLKILKVIEDLHNHNVLIGDLQPSNILITARAIIFFVDTDSFQIENYPCPVGDSNFTPPNRQGLDYSSYLRTKEDENFAIATLLFNIFMLRLFPYAHIGGNSEQENIKKGHFPYLPNGKITETTPPLGKKIWPKLPKYFQNSFYDYFTKKNNLNVSDWIMVLNQYQKDLIKSKDN